MVHAKARPRRVAGERFRGPVRQPGVVTRGSGLSGRPAPLPVGGSARGAEMGPPSARPAGTP
ncbi:MAG TPA: hypothetical protein VE913_21060, partial [Longimicrobium sp.]|nr:hypothetical protein [Longimicrobium sp.]